MIAGLRFLRLLPILGLVATALASPHLTAGESEDVLARGWQAILQENRLDDALVLFDEAAEAPERAAEAHFGRALIRLARGEDEACFDSLGQVISADPRSSQAAAALGHALGLQGWITTGGSRLEPQLSGIASASPGVDPEVVDLSRRALRTIGLRRGEPNRLTLAAEERGALTELALIGPYGRFDHLALDLPFPPEEGDLDPRDDPPGPDGLSPFLLEARFPAGTLTVPPQFRNRGVVYAVADLEADRPLRGILRVAGGTSFRAFLDGREVITADRRKTWLPNVLRTGIFLDAGRHRLLVKMGNGESQAMATVLLTDEEGRPLLGSGLRAMPLRNRPPRGRSEAFPLPVAPYEALREALNSPRPRAADLLALPMLAEALGDITTQRQALERAVSLWPESALVRYLVGTFYQYAPTGLSAAEDIARARTEYLAALEADPDLPMALFRLALLDWEDGKSLEAWDRLERCEVLIPDSVRWPLTLHRFAAEKRWLREAHESLQRARERLPDGPMVLDAALAFARSQGNSREVHRLARLLATQDPTEVMLADLLTQERSHDEAVTAWRQRMELLPISLRHRLGLVNALREAGRLREAIDILDEARKIYPDEPLLRSRRARLLGLLDRPEEAEGEYADLYRIDPSNLEVRRHLRRIQGQDPDFGYQVETGAVLEAAPEPAPGTDSALLVDQSITWVDRTGGALERYHAIFQVYTRDGVERESQPQVPPGSRYLELRVIKPDGTTYEPVAGEGGEITFPNLEPGDFIEYRYERYQPPSSQIPGAYDNDTLFVFQGGERPFVLSQYVLIHEEALPVEVGGRFGALDYEERREGRLRIRAWTARDMPSLALELNIPNRFDVSPHVRLSLRTTWEDVGDFLRNGWAPLLRPSPEMREAADRIAREHREPLARARAVHEHVTGTMRLDGPAVDFGTPASVSYSAGQGNRVLVAKALLDLLDLPHELVAARAVPNKGFFLDSPNPNQFGYPLLRVREGDRTAYLDLVQADHPFDRLPFFLRGSDALVVPDPGQGPVRIEELARGDSGPPLLEQEAGLLLAEDGSVSGHLRQSFTDVAADGIRQSIKSVPVGLRSQTYAQLIDLLFPGARHTEGSVTGLETLEAPLVLDLHMEGGSFGSGVGDRLTSPLLVTPTELRRAWASLETRRFALLIDDPASIREILRITPPPGYRLERIPEPVEVAGEFGRYRLVVEPRDDGSVAVTRELDLPFQRIEREDYTRFVAFAATVDRAEQRRLSFVPDAP